MTRSRQAVLSLIVATTVLLTGCNPFVSHRSIGVDATDVATIEFYEYPWGEDTETVDRLTLVNSPDNREVIEEWVRSYTDMPLTPIGSNAIGDAIGKQAQGVRFTLADGGAVDVTTIFVGRRDVIVIWQDGTVDRTDWGAPDLLAYYSEFGTVEQVDASERPQAELPGQR
jgi:hypothetical protein